MKILYILKRFPLRELLIIKYLHINYEIEFDCMVYSRRYYKEISDLIKTHGVPIGKFYDFVGFSKKVKSVNNIDLEILKFENYYSINMMRVMNSDRLLIKLPYSEAKQRIYNVIEFFTNEIRLNEYDYTIQELSGAGDLLCYFIMNKLKKVPIVYWHGRYYNKVEFTDINGSRHNLLKIYRTHLELQCYTNKDEELYHSLVNNVKEPPYMIYESNKQTILILKEIYKKIDFNLIKNFFLDRKYAIDNDPTIGTKFRNLYYLFRRNSTRVDYIPDNKFLIFPEQFTPEASTLTFSPYYYDQIEFIKLLRRNIPLNYIILIKLHPSMEHTRDKKYLSEISKIPACYYTHANNYELIKKCTCVITFTSTMGWEAILYDKPVISFGNVFYNDYKYIKKLDIKQLSDFFIFELGNWKRIINTPEYLENKKAFVLAAYKALMDGNLNSYKDKSIIEDDNIITLSETLIKVIKNS